MNWEKPNYQVEGILGYERQAQLEAHGASTATQRRAFHCSPQNTAKKYTRPDRKDYRRQKDKSALRKIHQVIAS